MRPPPASGTRRRSPSATASPSGNPPAAADTTTQLTRRVTCAKVMQCVGGVAYPVGRKRSRGHVLVPALNRAVAQSAPGRGLPPLPCAVAHSRTMTAFLPFAVCWSRREQAAGLDSRAVGLRSGGAPSPGNAAHARRSGLSHRGCFQPGRCRQCDGPSGEPYNQSGASSTRVARRLPTSPTGCPGSSRTITSPGFGRVAPRSWQNGRP